MPDPRIGRAAATSGLARTGAHAPSAACAADAGSAWVNSCLGPSVPAPRRQANHIGRRAVVVPARSRIQAKPGGATFAVFFPAG